MRHKGVPPTCFSSSAKTSISEVIEDIQMHASINRFSHKLFCFAFHGFYVLLCSSILCRPRTYSGNIAGEDLRFSPIFTFPF